MRWDEDTKASTRTSGLGPATSASARATIGTSTSAGPSSWRPRAGRRSQHHGGKATAGFWWVSRQQTCGGDIDSGGPLTLRVSIQLGPVRTSVSPAEKRYFNRLIIKAL